MWFCVSFGRNLRLAEHLLKLGASPQTRFTLPPTIATPRQSACSCDTEQISRSLPDVAKPRCSVPFGWSHFEAAEAMLECGANVNAQNDRGMTAAHVMLKKNSAYEHFALLARFKAPDWHLPDKQGITPAGDHVEEARSTVQGACRSGADPRQARATTRLMRVSAGARRGRPLLNWRPQGESPPVPSAGPCYGRQRSATLIPPMRR